MIKKSQKAHCNDAEDETEKLFLHKIKFVPVLRLCRVGAGRIDHENTEGGKENRKNGNGQIPRYSIRPFLLRPRKPFR